MGDEPLSALSGDILRDFSNKIMQDVGVIIVRNLRLVGAVSDMASTKDMMLLISPTIGSLTVMLAALLKEDNKTMPFSDAVEMVLNIARESIKLSFSEEDAKELLASIITK